MVTTLLIKGHKKWAVSASHSFLCIHTHTEKAQKWMMQHFSWPEGYTSTREGECTCGQLHLWFSLPQSLWGFLEPHGSRAAPAAQDTSDQVLATRVHQTLKFSILALKISHCFTCEVLKVCQESDYRCHHWRGWVFFSNFQMRRITSFSTQVSQAQFFSLCLQNRKFRLIRSCRGF